MFDNEIQIAPDEPRLTSGLLAVVSRLRMIDIKQARAVTLANNVALISAAIFQLLLPVVDS